MDNDFEIIIAIEEFVSSSKGVNSPGDSYLNIALALYKYNKGDSADLRIVNIIEQRLPKLLQETPTRLLEKLSVDNGVAIWWCLNSCAHNVYETERVYSCSPSLSRLAVYLADVRQGDRVYLPYAGLGLYTLYLPDGIEVRGEEEDEMIWALSQIIQWSRGKTDSSTINADSLKAMSNLPSDSIDRIIALPKFESAEEYSMFFDECLRVLAPGGKMIVTVTRYFCDSSSTADIRSRVIDHVQRIYSLGPVNLQGQTWHLLMMEIEKTKSPTIGMYLATDFLSNTRVTDGDTRYGRPYTALDDTALIEAIETDSLKHRTVGKEEILSNKCHFSPEEYVMPDTNSPYRTKRLSQLVEIVTTEDSESISCPKIMPNLRAANYLDSDLAAHIDSDHKSRRRILSERSIILRTFGKVQIVGRFVPTQELPAISLSYRSLTPLRIKKEAAGLISEDYLLRELFELCSIPAVRTFAILMDYPIPLPPIDEQQRILNEETHRHIGSIKHLLDQSQAHQQRLLSSIRHRILNDLSPIADFSISIKHLLSKSKDGLKANDLVVGDLTLEQALELIYANCMRTLESVSLLKELTEGRSEPIDLNDFFEKQLADGNLTAYKQIIQLHKNINDPEWRIMFPKTALMAICDNIISNAVSHGFGGIPRPGLDRIKIAWEKVGGTILLTIANNGRPSDADPEDIFIEGFTTARDQKHTGIGCKEIKDLMTGLGGDVEFVSDMRDEYAVTYKLTFNNIVTDD